MAATPRSVVRDAGTVTIAFSNNELFWHTFTISALGVEADDPVAGTAMGRQL